MMAVYDQQPIAYTGYGAPVYGTPAMYMPMAQAPAPVYRQQAPRVERVIERRYAPARTTNSVARNKRSTGKSVAIVAGSAGLGAAIGALAGGGKGAALGALAGGGGGFVYDQLTRNR
jgi:predicted S18 family serine protease